MIDLGQYFMPVNCTKREYFTAWEIGGVAKLWEWCANHEAGVLAYLLRKSDEGGGGDVEDIHALTFAGHWAGDEIYLVGDYDSSGLYKKATSDYRNIAQPLVAEYNRFMDCQERQLMYEPLDS
ncbi:MAG TPA: hypothetical protein P5121_18065 [Caldilineaceae bacterium]|nr:hypothetical protein [Caldilineaceae bacterium]